MSLQGELARFESLLGDRFPAVLAAMNVGLNDDEVERFREALLPMNLTHEIETLYRWRDGGSPHLFGGWQMLPKETVLGQRAFYLADLEEPPAWLHIFDDQTISFASLDVPGTGQVPGVWYGHTHDGWLSRLFISIESMVATCSDAIEAGLLSLVGREKSTGLRFAEDSSLDGRDFTPLRVAREPAAFVYPHPPIGTYLTRSPVPDWPAPWLASLGLDPTPPSLHGATCTVAELLDRAAETDVTATIVGKIVRFGGWAHEWSATVDDGTGRLSLIGPNQALFGAAMGDTAEFDVEIDSAVRRAEPGYADQYAQQRAFIRRMIPGVSARATAVRLISG
jgi:hypothetical protein